MRSSGATECHARSSSRSAGRLGPSFLVSENFYVLKRYNESDLYALFIGDLSNRMRGAAAFAGTWMPWMR
ncbi:lytic murein transglycosylase [Microvirga brassicacearum]|uniref:lytic murein transglycosylase n=1 Tax=Microvirga brassicacearum TaxID=2580413 RepID=UPI003B84665F